MCTCVYVLHGEGASSVFVWVHVCCMFILAMATAHVTVCLLVVIILL